MHTDLTPVDSGLPLPSHSHPAQTLPAAGHLAPRQVAPEQWLRFETSVGEILAAFGLDLDTAGTRETPRRFLTALFDATAGYEGDPKLLTAFPTECHGGADCRLSQVIEGPISFYALCEHHALPFHGVAHVGYVAHEQIIGISKLTRLVRLYARRFTVQERMGASRSPTPWSGCSPRTASRSGSRPRTCAPRCAACGRSTPAP